MSKNLLLVKAFLLAICGELAVPNALAWADPARPIECYAMYQTTDSDGTTLRVVPESKADVVFQNRTATLSKDLNAISYRLLMRDEGRARVVWAQITSKLTDHTASIGGARFDGDAVNLTLGINGKRPVINGLTIEAISLACRPKPPSPRQ